MNDIDEYERGSLLGDSGWFTVHAATHRPTGDKVVLKEHFEFLADDARYVSRILDVQHGLAQIEHPDLVAMYDGGWDGQRLWSAEQFVNGRSLFAWLREGWVTPQLGLRVAARVLRLLETLHSKGIVHGCLHPGTIRMAGPDEPRLGDFGYPVADPGLVGPRSTGTFAFYQRYCAPEVLAGAPATRASDLFSVGVMLRDCGAAEEIVRLATMRRSFETAAEMAAALDAMD